MSTTTTAKTRTPKWRTFRIAQPISPRTGRGNVMIQQMAAGSNVCEIDFYALRCYSADNGRATAVEVANHDGTAPYTCILARGVATCNCRGFQKWSRCKHAAALLVMQSRGMLKVPAARPELPRDF